VSLPPDGYTAPAGDQGRHGHDRRLGAGGRLQDEEIVDQVGTLATFAAAWDTRRLGFVA
jgi:hypothetical protein